MKLTLAAGLTCVLASAALAQQTAAPLASKPTQQPTPVAQREIEIVALDKLSGHSRILTLKPGESVAFRELTIAARTCEARAPGLPPESGAFLQISNGGKRLFSGWMFAVARSLNAFEHPGYAVWVKSCKMRFPDTGPDTVTVRAAVPKDAASKPADSKPADSKPADSKPAAAEPAASPPGGR